MRFEKGRDGVTAEYSKRPDGLIRVVNTCRQGGADRTGQGQRRQVVADAATKAKLKVSFFGPFFLGDYWVLDHADDYSWSIIGEGSGRYLVAAHPQAADAARVLEGPDRPGQGRWVATRRCCG